MQVAFGKEGEKRTGEGPLLAAGVKQVKLKGAKKS